MSFRVVVGFLGGAAYGLVAGTSGAQCTKDTDCKAARVCEQGRCASPPPAAEVADAAEPPRRSPRNWKRHSTGMMAGGIVMVAVAPVALLVSLIASLERDACQSGGRYNLDTTSPGDGHCDRYDARVYGGVILGVGLLGAGIPLTIIGGKREPLGTASVAPWATAGGGGLTLRLAL